LYKVSIDVIERKSLRSSLPAPLNWNAVDSGTFVINITIVVVVIIIVIVCHVWIVVMWVDCLNDDGTVLYIELL
jgi:hypothetical protein